MGNCAQRGRQSPGKSYSRCRRYCFKQNIRNGIWFNVTDNHGCNQNSCEINNDNDGGLLHNIGAQASFEQGNPVVTL